MVEPCSLLPLGQSLNHNLKPRFTSKFRKEKKKEKEKELEACMISYIYIYIYIYIYLARVVFISNNGLASKPPRLRFL